MNRGRLLPRVILTSPLASFPRTSILVLILFTCFATRAVAVSGALPNNTLGLFVVSVGSLPTEYVPVGPPIDATSSVFSMVLPSTKQWVVLNKYISESYAPITIYVFEQDSNVYQVIAWDPFSNYPGPCDFAHVAGTGLSIPTLQNGCVLDHLGVVGNSVYFRVPSTFNLFYPDKPNGGQLNVITNGKVTTLLGSSDPDNQATLDIADNGTLYAINHDTKNGTLKVWTRNLTTGHLETLLRNYAITESLFSAFCVKINDGIIYFGVGRKSDKSYEIWTTDLTVPLASQTVPGVLQTYPASGQGGISVTNGKVVTRFNSSSIKNGIAVLDVATGSTN